MLRKEMWRVSKTREERRLRRKNIINGLVFAGCIIICCGLPTWVEVIL